jgi:hypothetical protein
VQDFRLFRVVTLTPDTDAHVLITSDSATCGTNDQYLCRPLHIMVPNGVSVTVETSTSDDPNPVWLTNSIMPGQADQQRRLSLAGDGTTQNVQAFVDWGKTASFVVRVKDQ